MPPGRPPFEITPAVIQKAFELAARGLTEAQIASCLGICQDTLIQRKHEFPEFLEAIKKGQASGISQVANTLFGKAVDGDMTAAIFYLKARAKWNDKPVEIEVSEEQKPKRVGVDGLDPNGI